MTKTHDCPSNYKFSASQWWHHVPDHWTVRRIRTVADIRVSNVDKHTKEEELPVRLCNYVDVYKNDRITQQPRPMRRPGPSIHLPIRWMGRVPTHWEILSLGQVGTLTKGTGGNKKGETSPNVDF